MKKGYREIEEEYLPMDLLQMIIHRYDDILVKRCPNLSKGKLAWNIIILKEISNMHNLCYGPGTWLTSHEVIYYTFFHGGLH